MGIIDSVKNSISGGGEDSGSTFDNSQYDSSFQSERSGPEAKDPFQEDQGSQPPAQQQPRDTGQPSAPRPQGNDLQPPGSQQSRDPTPESPIDGSSTGQNSMRGQSSRGQDPLESPNAQAGRPEEGGSNPQVSSSTREKMEREGFDFDGGQERGGRPRDSDLQEIRSQNEQIIDLLKSIERKLGSRETGYREGRNSGRESSKGRHGGRR